MAALITRCPVCATMFKVVPDQLRVSEGWVRCGHCGEIFDANAHWQDAAMLAAQAGATSAPPPPAQAQARELETAGPSAAARDDSHLPARPASELPSEGPPSYSSSLHSQIDEVVLEDEVDPAELAAQARALREDPLDRPFELRREDLSRPGEPLPQAPAIVSSAPAALEEPAFVRQARRQARWRHRPVRALLLLVLVALAALLALQVAVQERDRLAAAQPQLRPWLGRLCGAVGCRIAPPRQIDAIAIDGSSFSKLRPDAYRLQVTLKNLGRGEVAMPALELTLTDTDDQPVVRRVLTPAELGIARASLAPQSEWSGSVAIAVADTSLASRISGYRLLAFYP